MITEDYVSFEVAKLLKEKGFEEEIWGYYPIKGDGIGLFRRSGVEYNHNNSQVQISAPTLQMAQKWLRERHKIVCNICIESRNFYYYDIFLIRSDAEAQFQLVSPKPYYVTYESACNAGIKYCLEKFV